MAKSRIVEINVYDFDNTIYNGDSSLDFYLFCVRRKPWVIVYLPYQCLHLLLFIIKAEKRTAFKSRFFIFLRRLKNTEAYVNKFWDAHYQKMAEWYMGLDHSKDVIISASPEFLLGPAAKKLGVYKLIATRMDPSTGRIDGENCRGQEKVARLRRELGNIKVAKAYGDSSADRPILQLAKEKYIVKHSKISPLSLPDPLD